MSNPGELERLRALVESLQAQLADQAQLAGSGAIAQGRVRWRQVPGVLPLEETCTAQDKLDPGETRSPRPR